MLLFVSMFLHYRMHLSPLSMCTCPTKGYILVSCDITSRKLDICYLYFVAFIYLLHVDTSSFVWPKCSYFLILRNCIYFIIVRVSLIRGFGRAVVQTCPQAGIYHFTLHWTSSIIILYGHIRLVITPDHLYLSTILGGNIYDS